MAALRRARASPCPPHKVGPDYIDPGYHALATGRPGRNLDPRPGRRGPDRPAVRCTGRAGARRRRRRGRDGPVRRRGWRDGHGSTAHVAELLRAPVVLVVDASSQSRSRRRRCVHGFATFDPAVRVAGVILNQVGSRPARGLLREALRRGRRPGARRAAAAGASWPRRRGTSAWCRPPSAARRRRAVEAMAELVAAHVDLDAVVRLAEPIAPGPAWDPAVELAAAAPDARRRPCGRRAARPRIAPRGRRPRGRWSRSPGARRSPSATPSTTELLAAAGRRGRRLRPAARRAPARRHGRARPRAAASRRCTPRSCPRTSRCAPPSPTSPRPVPGAAECAGLLYLCADLDGHPMCGCPARDRRHDRPAHPRLPRGRGAHRPVPSRPGSGCAGTSSTTARSPPGPGPRRPGGGAAPSPRASCRRRARVVPAHPLGRRPGSRRALRPRRRTINPLIVDSARAEIVRAVAGQPDIAAARSAHPPVM